MKKFIALLLVMLSFGVVMAQVGKTITFTPTTNDSIVGAATKYCTYSSSLQTRVNGIFEVYITPSISSSDSTHIWIEQSYNNSTWYKATGLGAPMITGTATYYTSNASTIASGYEYKVKMGTTAVGVLWSPTWYLNAPYYRIAVQHFKAATSVKITRAIAYLKK